MWVIMPIIIGMSQIDQIDLKNWSDPHSQVLHPFTVIMLIYKLGNAQAI